MLHLHRLQHGQPVTGLYGLPRPDEDRLHKARHRRNCGVPGSPCDRAARKRIMRCKAEALARIKDVDLAACLDHRQVGRGAFVAVDFDPGATWGQQQCANQRFFAPVQPDLAPQRRPQGKALQWRPGKIGRGEERCRLNPR